jgi:hypothetical protein
LAKPRWTRWRRSGPRPDMERQTSQCASTSVRGSEGSGRGWRRTGRYGICPTGAARQVGQLVGRPSAAGGLSAAKPALRSAGDNEPRPESPPGHVREGQLSCAACRSRRRSRARARRSTVASPGPPPLRQIATRLCRQASMWRVECAGDSTRPSRARTIISPTSTSSTSTGLTCRFTTRLPSRLRFAAIPLRPRTASRRWRMNGTLGRSMCWIGPLHRGAQPPFLQGLLWRCSAKPQCGRRPAVNFSSPQGV